MGRTTTAVATVSLRLLFATLILPMYFHVSRGQWDPHHPVPPVEPAPLCLSQFALVNNACGKLPFEPIPPPSPDEPNPPNPPSPEEPDDDEGRRRSRRRGHGHSHDHGHGPRQVQRHGDGGSDDPMLQDCCRWLKEVDDVCVCDLLVRLPPFLTRPAHEYTILVGDVCQVTFECPSRIVK